MTQSHTENDGAAAKRTRDLIAAYGADPARWPEAERHLARGLEAFSAERAAETALDALLGTAAPAPATPEFRRAVLSMPDRAPGWRSLLDAIWPFEAVWRPAGGLVAAAVVGVFVGFGTPASPTAAGTATVADTAPGTDYAVSDQLSVLLGATGAAAADEGMLPR